MRSWRVMVRQLTIDDVVVDASYADVFLVVREGEDGPGPSDWEATVRTEARQNLRPGRYQLWALTGDDVEVQGPALLRFSDGHQHLFRGDGLLAGAAEVTT